MSAARLPPDPPDDGLMYLGPVVAPPPPVPLSVPESFQEGLITYTLFKRDIARKPKPHVTGWEYRGEVGKFAASIKVRMYGATSYRARAVATDASSCGKALALTSDQVMAAHPELAAVLCAKQLAEDALRYSVRLRMVMSPELSDFEEIRPMLSEFAIQETLREMREHREREAHPCPGKHASDRELAECAAAARHHRPARPSVARERAAARRALRRAR